MSSKVVMESVKSLLASATSAKKFSKSYCPFCDRVKQLFKTEGIAFNAVELDKESNGADMQAALKVMSGQRTVPNIYIGDTHIGGCDDAFAKKASFKDLMAKL